MRQEIAAIHQFHESVASGDAIGNILFAYRKLFREMSCTSEIFRVYEHGTATETRPIGEYEQWSSPRNLLIVHYSMGWASWPAFLRLKDRRILVYHNITPAEYFEDVSSVTAKLCEKGRHDLPRLAKYFSGAIADSNYNAEELRQAGFHDVVVIPPLVNLEPFATERSEDLPPDPLQTVDWLFVGRIAPNKQQDAVIRAFGHYQKQIRAASRLFLVGGEDGDAYGRSLRNLVEQLELENVHFTGKLGFQELLERYRQSSVFVCLSVHEGFCVPLLEAMKCGLPIVAYAQEAVAETLNGAGLLLNESCPETVARAVEQIVTDRGLRQSLREKGLQRLAHFDYQRVSNQIRSFVGRFISSAAPKKRRNKIRVACATLRYFPYIGGAETVLQNVVERLANDGFDFTIYATDAKRAEDIFVDSAGPETTEDVNGIRVIRSPIKNPPKKDRLAKTLDYLSVYGHGAWSQGQFKHLLRDEFDIVHSTPFPSTHNYLAFLAASFRRKPFVCHPHLHLADAYHSDRRSLFAMMRRSAGVATNTTFERDYYIKRGVSPRKLHVTGVGCEANFDPPTEIDRPARAREFPGYERMRKLIFVGRKDPHKGIHDVLNAMRLLTLGRSDILFVCVGPETDYSGQLWRTIPDQLVPHILVLNDVSEREKHALIQDSDMLILMSTTESFGIVFLEAWSHGKPVIGAKAGAIQSVIQDGVDGLLVEPGNTKELAAAIEFLLDHPHIGERLGQKGRVKTQEQFTWDKVAETWGRIFWEASKSE